MHDKDRCFLHCIDSHYYTSSSIYNAYSRASAEFDIDRCALRMLPIQLYRVRTIPQSGVLAGDLFKCICQVFRHPKVRLSYLTKYRVVVRFRGEDVWNRG